ncbi:MAG: transposase [Anaerolineaceae bacterium]
MNYRKGEVMGLPQRRSIRLPGFDYSQSGIYFITIRTHNRRRLFGTIRGGKMRLSKFGEIILEEIERTPSIRQEIIVDVFQILPDHIHIVIIISPVGAHGCAPEDGCAPAGGRPSAPTMPIRKPKSDGSFIAGFKSITTSRINKNRANLGVPVWQRNYYEHIIRDDEDWERIREYILSNPSNWGKDSEFTS